MQNHKDWLEVALFMAKKLSKCHRAQYAVIFLDKDGHLVGSGYNGKPKNSICNHLCFRQGEGPKEACCVHAEINGLMWTNPERRKGGTAYVTGIPCDNCFVALLDSGISTLVYLNSSDTDKHICNIVGEGFYERYQNGVKVIPLEL